MLAVSVGTFHGMDISGITPHIRLERLKEIGDSLNVFLVLHGGSGTPEDDIKEAIKLGIVKININTELRLAYSGNLRKALSDINEITPYKFLAEPAKSVRNVTAYKIELFGSKNKI